MLVAVVTGGVGRMGALSIGKGSWLVAEVAGSRDRWLLLAEVAESGRDCRCNAKGQLTKGCRWLAGGPRNEGIYRLEACSHLV